jgi:UDP-N-acetylglucosamine 2-epimerase (non-hydrolysing)
LTIALVAGARPNFMKIAPLVWELNKQDEDYKLIHTGQHYDINMSKVFFGQLSLPEPDYYLGVGSGTHAYQTATAMLGLEKAFLETDPRIVVVVGDVNSTLAGALAAAKLEIPIAHIEAGLRSFDRNMPEEINRILTDALCELLFTTCVDANTNLRREGIAEERIFFVGNTMIDTLMSMMEEICRSPIVKDLGLSRTPYLFITIHRPSNVDNPSTLAKIIAAFEELSDMGLKMVFPVHPRTRSSLEKHGLYKRLEAIKGSLLTEPLQYVDSMAIMRSAQLVLTDSGGLQEETTFLGVPCLTLRPNTERPVTITEGTNILLDKGPGMIPEEVKRILGGEVKTGRVPELWEGRAAQRIVPILQAFG